MAEAKTAPNAAETATPDVESRILQAYETMVVMDESPINALTLAERAGVDESTFYQHYANADAVGRQIWANLGEQVFGKLNESETFHSYSAREKLLTIYFTFFDQALTKRLFIERTLDRPALLSSYKDAFLQFVNDVVQEGIASEEIKERLSLSNYYGQMMWELHLRLIRFWLQDDSPRFEKTDRAVEVYAKLPLEFMGHNILDSVLETAKFSFNQFDLNQFRPGELGKRLRAEVEAFFNGR